MPVECTDDVLRSIAPAFRHYLQHVWKELEFGLHKSKVEVERIRTGEEESDQFSLVLPYCGRQIKWDVIFDKSAPWFAPDFRFDDDFLLDADEGLLELRVPSLHQWDANDPRALSRVIAELMALYRDHQKKLLSADESSRAWLEYCALLDEGGVSAEDVEVWAGASAGAGAGAPQFLVRLQVDTRRLPELFHDGWERNPGGECALLLVRPPPSAAPPELLLSPLVSRAVGEPCLSAVRRQGRGDYVPVVTSIINNKIESALANEKLKRQLVSQLVVKYEGAVLEHDSRSAAFLLEHQGFYFILQVEIGDNFPLSTPTLTLRSVYHSSRGKPRSKVLAACPYADLDRYLRQQVELFRQECAAAPPHAHTHVIRIDT